jgi:putative FmdB family regulatory protein
MPIYEYECSECGRFEVIQKFSDQPLKQCPNCKEKGKSNPVTKAVSASAFHLKGSGWYKTDYTSGASSTAGGAKKSNSSKAESTSSSDASGSDASTTAAPKKACGSGCGCH